MRHGCAVLIALACSALPGCGGDDATAEPERPKDFRTAASEVCREHNVQVDEVRDRHRQADNLDEVVEAIRDEALVKEDQLKDLRALDPPPAAKSYFERLERNVEGMRRAALELRPGDEQSYNQFWVLMQNSEDLANREANALDLEDCSPPVAQ